MRFTALHIRMNDKERHFQKAVLDYYKQHSRSFPWRETSDPYAIMVSEIMLQQTQADRVVPKYIAFMETFPNTKSLCKATLPTVFGLWQGLGYNRRAKHLKEAACKIESDFGGVVPKDTKDLTGLPGIGPYTAGAIRAFAFNEQSFFIETNIRTVFIHHFFADKTEVLDVEIMEYIKRLHPRVSTRVWYNALMDYGAMLKQLHGNPNKNSKHYTKQKPFKGSIREVRGALLRALLSHSDATKDKLQDLIAKEDEYVSKALAGLVEEGMVIRQGNKYRLAD